MNGGFAQYNLAGVVGSRAAQFFGRNYQAQRLQPEAGAAGDDEIAGIQQSFVIFPGGDFQKLIRADDEVELIVRMFAAITADGIESVENVRSGSVRRRFGE